MADPLTRGEAVMNDNDKDQWLTTTMKKELPSFEAYMVNNGRCPKQSGAVNDGIVVCRH